MNKTPEQGRYEPKPGETQEDNKVPLNTEQMGKQREQLEALLADRIRLKTRDGKNGSPKIKLGYSVWADDESPVFITTVDFEPTETGVKIQNILGEYTSQNFGGAEDWIFIRAFAVQSAYELASRHNRIPSTEEGHVYVSRNFSSPVYELGVNLRIEEGQDVRNEDRDRAIAAMNRLAEKIQALGVECLVEEK